MIQNNAVQRTSDSNYFTIRNRDDDNRNYICVLTAKTQTDSRAYFSTAYKQRKSDTELTDKNTAIKTGKLKTIVSEKNSQLYRSIEHSEILQQFQK